jgi:hypothetical protein
VTDKEIEEKAPLYSSLPLAKQKAISFFNYVYPDMICKSWLKLKHDDIAIDHHHDDQVSEHDANKTSEAAPLDISHGQQLQQLTNVNSQDETTESFEDNEMQAIEVSTSNDHLHIYTHHSSNCNINNADDVALSDSEFDINVEDKKETHDVDQMHMPLPQPSTLIDNINNNTSIDSTAAADILNCNIETTSPATTKSNAKRKSDEFGDIDGDSHELEETEINKDSVPKNKSNDSATKNNSKRQRPDRNQTSASITLHSSSSTASSLISSSSSVGLSAVGFGQRQNTAAANKSQKKTGNPSRFQKILGGRSNPSHNSTASLQLQPHDIDQSK